MWAGSHVGKTHEEVNAYSAFCGFVDRRKMKMTFAPSTSSCRVVRGIITFARVGCRQNRNRGFNCRSSSVEHLLVVVNGAIEVVVSNVCLAFIPYDCVNK